MINNLNETTSIIEILDNIQKFHLNPDIASTQYLLMVHA